MPFLWAGSVSADNYAICDDYPYLCHHGEIPDYYSRSSSVPTTRHSAAGSEARGLFMIDCGEGAVQFRKSRLKFSRLNRIFISHLQRPFRAAGTDIPLNLLGRSPCISPLSQVWKTAACSRSIVMTYKIAPTSAFREKPP